MDNKELYEKIKEELREEIIEAKNEMRCMLLSYKQERLNIEKELLCKARKEIDEIIEFNDKAYNNNRNIGDWSNKLQDEYNDLNNTQQKEMIDIREKLYKLYDEEKRNSDEIYNLKNNKIPVALPIVDSYYIN